MLGDDMGATINLFKTLWKLDVVENVEDFHEWTIWIADVRRYERTFWISYGRK